MNTSTADITKEDLASLHPSLLELSEQAPRVTSQRTLHGMLCEARELVRNAINHGESPRLVCAWYSEFFRGAMSSKPAARLARGQIWLAGSVGHGDGIITAPVHFLTRKPAIDFQHFVGSTGHDMRVHYLSDRGWEKAVRRTLRDYDLATMQALADCPDIEFDDAAASCMLSRHALMLLRLGALQLRPPHYAHLDGFPDPLARVDILGALLEPISAIARWASLHADRASQLLVESPAAEAVALENDVHPDSPGATPAIPNIEDFRLPIKVKTPSLSTPGRLLYAAKNNILPPAAAEDLIEAWDAGLNLLMRRWVDGVKSEEAQSGDLPNLQRAQYGAACRQVSAVLGGIAEQTDF